MMKRLVAHPDNMNKEENKKETDSGPDDKNNSIGVNCCAFDRNAIIEFNSACTLLLQTASQYSEHEWLAIFLFLLKFYVLLKVGDTFLSYCFVGYFVLKYGRHISFLLIGWMVIGIAVSFYGLKATTNNYVFEECCSNNRHSPFLFEMTTSRNAAIQGVPYYVTEEFFLLQQDKPRNLVLLESKIVETYLKCLRELQLWYYFNSTSSFLLELPSKFFGYLMSFLLLLMKIVLIPLSYKFSKTRCSTLVSYVITITVCAAILLVTMDSKERQWSVEHRPPFVMEMRVRKDPRMNGIPYFVKKKYHNMERNAILQQEVETSVVNYYEGNIRSCLSINNSIETCLEKVFSTVIQRNDVVGESALYFNLYEGKIRSCLRSMNSIEMCIRQVIIEIQRNTDDYKKARNDLYEGKFHSCLRSMNNEDACIQKVAAERQRHFIYYRPSNETLGRKLQTLTFPLAFSEYEVKTRISMLRHYNKRDGTLNEEAIFVETEEEVRTETTTETTTSTTSSINSEDVTEAETDIQTKFENDATIKSEEEVQRIVAEQEEQARIAEEQRIAKEQRIAVEQEKGTSSSKNWQQNKKQLESLKSSVLPRNNVLLQKEKVDIKIQ